MDIIDGWEAANSDLVLEVRAAHRLAEAMCESAEDDAARTDAADRTLAAQEQAKLIAGHGAGPLELEDLASALLCSAEEAASARLASDEQEAKLSSLSSRDQLFGSLPDADHLVDPHADTVAAYADTVAASIRDAADAAYSLSELDANCEMAVQASLHSSNAAAPSSSSPSTALDAYDSDDDPLSCLAWPSWRQESEWTRQVAEHRACAKSAATAAAAAAVKASFSSGAIFIWHRKGSRTAQGAAWAIQTSYWSYRRRTSRARRERRAALRPIRVAKKKLAIAVAAVATSLASGAIFAWHRSGPKASTHAVIIIQAALRLRLLRPAAVPSPGAPTAPALPPCRSPPRLRYSLTHPGDHQAQGTHILLVLAAHDAARTIQACQRARRPSASDSDTDASMPALASDPPSDCDDDRYTPTQGGEESPPTDMNFLPCPIANTPPANTPPTADPHAAASTIQRAIRALLHLRGGGDSSSESSWGDPAPVVLMGTPVHYSSSTGSGDMRQNSIVLAVPYTHRHIAMTLGASWDPCRRVWWAPNEPHWVSVLANYRPRRPTPAEIARGNAPLGHFRSTAPVSLSSSPDPPPSSTGSPPPRPVPPPVADGVAQREIRQYFPVCIINPDRPCHFPPPPPLAQPPQACSRTETAYVDLLQNNDHGAPQRLSKAAAQHRAARHPRGPHGMPPYAGMPCDTCGHLISAVRPGTTSGGQVVHDTQSCLATSSHSLADHVPTITPVASRPPPLPTSVGDAQRELAKWGERVSPTGEPPSLEWYHTRITQVRLEAHIASMPSPQRYHTSGSAAFSAITTVMMSPGPDAAESIPPPTGPLPPTRTDERTRASALPGPRTGTFGTPRRPVADASVQTESTWQVTTVIAILLVAAVSGCAIAGATPGVRFIERCETPAGPEWPTFYAIKRMGPWWNAYVDAADSITTATCIPAMILAVGHTVMVAIFAILLAKACTAWHVSAQNRSLPPAMAHVWRAAEITTARAASAAATATIATNVAARAARRAIARCPDVTFVALAILSVVLAFTATTVAPASHLSLAGPSPASVTTHTARAHVYRPSHATTPIIGGPLAPAPYTSARVTPPSTAEPEQNTPTPVLMAPLASGEPIDVWSSLTTPQAAMLGMARPPESTSNTGIHTMRIIVDSGCPQFIHPFAHDVQNMRPTNESYKGAAKSSEVCPCIGIGDMPVFVDDGEKTFFHVSRTCASSQVSDTHLRQFNNLRTRASRPFLEQIDA